MKKGTNMQQIMSDERRMYLAYLRSTRSCLRGLDRAEREGRVVGAQAEESARLARASWEHDLAELLANPVA